MKNIIKNLFNKIRGEVPTSQLIKMGLKVGRNFKRMDSCRIDFSHCWLIEIGENVTLAPHVIILAHDASTKMELGYTKVATVKIGNNVFVGAGSIILPGVKIGDNVVIGAGSVVAKNIPSCSVAVGNPCKVVKPYEQYMQENKNLMKEKPVYGIEYTTEGNITPDLKDKMKSQLQDTIGYVI